MLEDNGATSGALAVRAYSYLRLAEYDLSIMDSTEAIKVDASCLLAHEVKAESLLWTNVTDGAFAGAEYVLRINPNSSAALIVRGECWRRLGYYQNTIADLTHALALAGPDVVALATRAEAYIALGRIADAKEDLKAACKFDPDYTFASDLLAHIS
jgi:tetratricopeptide (TPR) repeat protein